MAHEQPGQIVGQAESLGAGARQRLGQCLLHGNGHVEAVLDVLLLAHRVGRRLAVHVERPAEHPGQNGPLPDARRARTVLPLAMAVDDNRGFAVVRDVSALLAREPPVALGCDALLRVRKLGEPLGSVVEEGEYTLVVVEHEHPVEHLAGGVDDADPLRNELGATDLAVEPAFLVVGRVIDQARLEGHGHKIGVDATNDVRIGEDRLTGGAGEHSAARVVDGPVDEDPEQGRFVLGARLLEPFEQTALPGNLAPGDLGRLQGLDLRLQGFGSRQFFFSNRGRLGPGETGE